MRIASQNPKGSYIYNTNDSKEYSTPMGSHFAVGCIYYKHNNPTDCFMCDKLKEAAK